MPYKNLIDLPESIREHLPKHAQEIQGDLQLRLERICTGRRAGAPGGLECGKKEI